jgi:hypothetical protein
MRILGAEGFAVDETDDARIGLRRALLPSMDGLTVR